MSEEILHTFDRVVGSTPIGFYNELFRLHDVGMQGVIPAIVVKYDSQTHTVSVLPIVKNAYQMPSKYEYANRPIYKNIPIYRISQSGFVVESPMFVGQTGLLVAIDRSWGKAKAENGKIVCEDDAKKGEDGEEVEPAFTKNKGAQPPDDFGLANFANGIFIPYSWSTNYDNQRVRNVSNSKDIGSSNKIRKATYKDSGENGGSKMSFISDATPPPGPSIIIRQLKPSDDGKLEKLAEDDFESFIQWDRKRFLATIAGHTIILDKNGLRYVDGYSEISKKDGEAKKPETIRCIAELRYDAQSHQIQARYAHATKRNNVVYDFVKEYDETKPEDGWTMISGGQVVEETVEETV